MRNDALPIIGDAAPYYLGRTLLALYFFVPGLSKIANFAGTAEHVCARRAFRDAAAHSDNRYSRAQPSCSRSVSRRAGSLFCLPGLPS